MTLKELGLRDENGIGLRREESIQPCDNFLAPRLVRSLDLRADPIKSFPPHPFRLFAVLAQPRLEFVELAVNAVDSRLCLARVTQPHTSSAPKFTVSRYGVDDCTERPTAGTPESRSRAPEVARRALEPH